MKVKQKKKTTQANLNKSKFVIMILKVHRTNRKLENWARNDQKWGCKTTGLI